MHELIFRFFLWRNRMYLRGRRALGLRKPELRTAAYGMTSKLLPTRNSKNLTWRVARLLELVVKWRRASGYHCRIAVCRLVLASTIAVTAVSVTNPWNVLQKETRPTVRRIKLQKEKEVTSEMNYIQDKRSIYDVTKRRLRAAIVAAEKQ